MARNDSTRRAFLRTAGTLITPGLILSASPAARAANRRPQPGAVYALTNSPGGNLVAVFARAADGTITLVNAASTGGAGLGDGPDREGLQSQGALILGPENRRLYAVNGGSDDISVFAVNPRGGLSLIQTVGSGGPRPISLSIHGGLLYALNYDRLAMPPQGGNITGFRVTGKGLLTPLANSARPLSGIGTNPGQVAFSPDGRVLAVTEKATNQILTYTVDGRGFAAGPRAFPSLSDFPFSLAFSPDGVLVVADDFEDVPTRGAASSFQVARGGTLTHASGPVPNFQDGTCWVVAGADGRFAHVVSTNNGVLTTYVIGPEGGLTRLDANGFTAFSGGLKPRDLAFGGDGAYLYVLNSASGSVGGFRVLGDGHLAPLALVGGLPFPGSNGLAAF
jgi:6-phosphogluconolactonase (cycloisomerase 2 family)